MDDSNDGMRKIEGHQLSVWITHVNHQDNKIIANPSLDQIVGDISRGIKD